MFLNSATNTYAEQHWNCWFKQGMSDDSMIWWKHREDFVSQENAVRTKQKSLFLRLISMNRPEWKIILLGCIVCTMNGATQTLLVILLAKIVSVSVLFIQIAGWEWVRCVGFWQYSYSLGVQLLCIFWQDTSSSAFQLYPLACGSFYTNSSFCSGKHLRLHRDQYWFACFCG